MSKIKCLIINPDLNFFPSFIYFKKSDSISCWEGFWYLFNNQKMKIIKVYYSALSKCVIFPQLVLYFTWICMRGLVKLLFVLYLIFRYLNVYEKYSGLIDLTAKERISTFLQETHSLEEFTAVFYLSINFFFLTWNGFPINFPKSFCLSVS